MYELNESSHDKRPTNAWLSLLLASFLRVPSFLAGLFPWIPLEGLMAFYFKQLKRDLNVLTGLQDWLVEERLLVGLSLYLSYYLPMVKRRTWSCPRPLATVWHFKALTSHSSVMDSLQRLLSEDKNELPFRCLNTDFVNSQLRSPCIGCR